MSENKKIKIAPSYAKIEVRFIGDIDKKYIDIIENIKNKGKNLYDIELINMVIYSMSMDRSPYINQINLEMGNINSL